jgi:hypothetical protein
MFVGAISLAYTQTNQKVMDPVHIQPVLLMSESADKTAVRVDTMKEKIEDIKYEKFNIVTNPIVLSTLNPGMVYFAISLIIVAAFLQLLNVFIYKKDVAWIVFFLIVSGFIAELFWGRNFQPQLEGLVQRASLLPETQENWVLWTVRTAFLAILLQMIHLFVTKFEKVLVSSHHHKAGMIYRRNRILMSLILITMLSSAFCVVLAERLESKQDHNEQFGIQFLHGQ